MGDFLKESRSKGKAMYDRRCKTVNLLTVTHAKMRKAGVASLTEQKALTSQKN
jgi:hypothetical protein